MNFTLIYINYTKHPSLLSYFVQASFLSFILFFSTFLLQPHTGGRGSVFFPFFIPSSLPISHLLFLYPIFSSFIPSSLPLTHFLFIYPIFSSIIPSSLPITHLLLLYPIFPSFNPFSLPLSHLLFLYHIFLSNFRVINCLFRKCSHL